RGLWVGAVSLWAVSAAWSVAAKAPEVGPPFHPSTPLGMTLSVSKGQDRQQASTSAVAAPQGAVTQYCVTCHNDRLKTSGLSLEKLDPENAAANAEIWENVARKLQARAMPPQGARRPDEATYRTLESAIEQSLDAQAATHPNPGAPILHRLNRSEYANAIRDLLALDADVTSLLPPD